MTTPRSQSLSAADVERIAAEADAALRGARVRTGRPRGRAGFVIGARKDGENRFFLAVLDPPLVRAHLVLEGAGAAAAEGEATKTPFHDQLRASIEGMTIGAVAAIAGDRALTIDLEGERPLRL